jgi:hypothetical protein
MPVMWRSVCLVALAILLAVVVTPASAHTPGATIDSSARLDNASSRDSDPPAGLHQADVSRAGLRHHLGQTRHADECLFASASAHLTALAPDAVCLDLPAGAAVFRQADSQLSPVDRPIAGHHQRAPPLTAS